MLENSRNYGDNLTPTLNYFQNLKPLSCKRKDEISEIIDETNPQIKEVLENNLQTGIHINNENTFHGLERLLKKYFNININPSFDAMNQKKSFIVARNNPENSGFSYHIAILDRDENGNMMRLGFIDENGNFVSSPLRYAQGKRMNIAHPGLHPTSIDIFPQEATINNTPRIGDKNITIKKGDTLWKLIEANYDIPDDGEKNRNIANIALKLRKMPQNKGIIHTQGGIHSGKKIFFPHEISTIRIPREEKKFTLKKEAI